MKLFEQVRKDIRVGFGKEYLQATPELDVQRRVDAEIELMSNTRLLEAISSALDDMLPNYLREMGFNQTLRFR